MKSSSVVVVHHPSPSRELSPASNHQNFHNNNTNNTNNLIHNNNNNEINDGVILADDESLRHRIESVLSPLLAKIDTLRHGLFHCSQYGLGVALILCVTVIWVASSEWIQYIFGSLDYNKPYFLTYFNTTGFCLWNAGFFFSAKWRRTPWDDATEPQPICVEDPQLREEIWIEEEKEDAHVDAARGHHQKTKKRRGRKSTREGGEEEVIRQDDDENEEIPKERRGAADMSRKHTPARRRERSNQISSSSPTPTTHRQREEDPDDAPHKQEKTREERKRGSPSPPLDSSWGDNDDIEGSGQRVEEERHRHYLHRYGGVRFYRTAAMDECRDYSLNSSFASSFQEELFSVSSTSSQEGGHSGFPSSLPPSSPPTRSMNEIVSGSVASPTRPRRRYIRRERVRRYSLIAIWRCAFCFCPLWFFANYLFNLSLSITSVASNTILSSTSSIWTLLLSYVLLGESIGPHQWVAVALCVGGSMMVGLSDRHAGSEHHTVIGDLIALISAFFYAAYTSVLKLHLPEDHRFAMGMVFGAVGVINFFLLWPGLVILDWVDAENFAWPTSEQFWPLVMNALIGTNLSDVLWARSVVLTSPVVATLGLSLTTPLAMIVDAVLKQQRYNGLYVAGAVLVMVGFVMANVPMPRALTRMMKRHMPKLF